MKYNKYKKQLKDWIKIRIEAFKHNRRYRKEIFIKILCPLILIAKIILINLPIKEK